MSEDRSRNWGTSALLTAAVAGWIIYGMATATEAPSRAVTILQYIVLGCALIGLVGSVAKYLSQK